jgi:hypothetical protein
MIRRYVTVRVHPRACGAAGGCRYLTPNRYDHYGCVHNARHVADARALLMAWPRHGEDPRFDAALARHITARAVALGLERES